MNNQILEKAVELLADYRLSDDDELFTLLTRILRGEMVTDRQLASTLRSIVDMLAEEAEYASADEQIDPEEYDRFVAADYQSRVDDYNAQMNTAHINNED